MDELESELASLPEENAERRGQLDRHHRLHGPPPGGGTHAVVQQGQDPGQAPQADAVHLQPGYKLPEGLRTLVAGHVGRRGEVLEKIETVSTELVCVRGHSSASA